jgi:hypothetical protein
MKSSFAVHQHYSGQRIIRLFLPDDPPFVLVWVEGFARYTSFPTYLYGEKLSFFLNYVLRDPQQRLRLRLERGDTTQDLTLSFEGYWQALQPLNQATQALVKRLRDQDRGR